MNPRASLIAAAGVCLAFMCGCASPDGTQAPSVPSSYLECVPYARAHSTVKLFGDAYQWWAKAVGVYETGSTPKPGSVMALSGYAGPSRGHLAIVRVVISAREIRVDHANWLNDGAVYLNDPVYDVSARNDWSIVRVWNLQSGAWGGKVYPVQGFIGPEVVSPSLLSGLEEETFRVAG
jgi:hypothetical protein